MAVAEPLAAIEHLKGKHEQKHHAGRGSATDLRELTDQEKTRFFDLVSTHRQDSFQQLAGFAALPEHVQRDYSKYNVANQEMFQGEALSPEDIAAYNKANAYADLSEGWASGGPREMGAVYEGAVEEFGLTVEAGTYSHDLMNSARSKGSPAGDVIIANEIEHASDFVHDSREAIREAVGDDAFENGKVTLYRGIGRELQPNEEFDISTGAASSWSMSLEVADSFATGASFEDGGPGTRKGTVLIMDVPIKSIVGMPGTGIGSARESEVVVAGVNGLKGRALGDVERPEREQPFDDDYDPSEELTDEEYAAKFSTGKTWDEIVADSGQ